LIFVASRRLAIALAALGIAGIGFATFALPLVVAGEHISSAVSSVSATITTLTATPTAVANYPYDCPKVETVGNLTWTFNPCAGGPFRTDFTSSAQASGTLDSPQVQAFIKNAYEYHVVYFKQKFGDPSRAQVIMNVTGIQVVGGNWSTGYQISYVGNSVLNVTVALVAPSSYEVSHLSVYNLPDRHTSLGFTAQQQKVIGAAASDAKAERLMAGGPYYVVFVSPLMNNTVFVGPRCPGYSGNSSVVVKSYDVQFNQVNGYLNVQVYVDGNFSALSRTMSNQPYRSLTGYGNGVVITDPWISGYVDSQQGPACPQ
jgi:hypothetical protein